MIPYMGCEHARELLDAFLDDELPVSDQVAVESHLRWCRTCSLRVEDMRLIGASLRLGSPVKRAGGDDTQALSAIAAGTLARVRAERADSLGVRVRELFVDMRLLWPALGATAAVAICVTVAGAVLQASSRQQPESLADIIQVLSERGSERNPLRPDGGNSIPRILGENDGELLAGLPAEDGVLWLDTVIGRDGRVASLDLVRTQGHDGAGDHDRHVEAVLHAIRLSRFAPAQTPTGRAVAVNVGWLFVMTTAEKETQKPEPRPADAVLAAPADRIQPAIQPIDIEETVPADRRSSTGADLPTA
jgi:hypothetical protein